MTHLQTFFWAFLGSVAVELVTAGRMFQGDSREVPGHYKWGWFWAWRVGLAVLGGFLAVGYGVQDKILAMNIGASAPLLINGLALGIPSPPEVPKARPSRRPPKRESSP